MGLGRYTQGTYLLVVGTLPLATFVGPSAVCRPSTTYSIYPGERERKTGPIDESLILLPSQHTLFPPPSPRRPTQSMENH
ncbi:hypothetical protein F5X98DRAFT_344573 [Xylaria grammica]|nr:hypothetical protein F5X98DRAFT_344573 [Xylaria grammica]